MSLLDCTVCFVSCHMTGKLNNKERAVYLLFNSTMRLISRCFAGEVVGNEERERRMVAAKTAGEPHFYDMELAPGLTIDGRAKSNIARLINTSCSPNCSTQKWTDAATGDCLFFHVCAVVSVACACGQTCACMWGAAWGPRAKGGGGGLGCACVCQLQLPSDTS